MIRRYQRKVGDVFAASCLALIGLSVGLAIFARRLDRALRLPAAVFGGVA